ncbi:MAG: hypothetical protein A2Z11_01795 [Candidatus Woykebacteria bacterium RBG_16_43_9]|uniref:Protein containing YHS domain protein n=1 Tax=Candidatus Woykebacteria bacterium RBG_16_43_9 TaxID=1802596 RepID=A0A1G1WBX1_9BACT|nr:MAG: hypothetical protein A2Z11_01795 [Candidatus Woykebacteria bacterium RBG_16_43_9]
MSFKICVSGAAEGDCVNPQTMAKAEEVGAAIARSGAILVTGATTGIPHAATAGAKKVGGISIGFSPASSRIDHINRYKLPTNYLDLTVYTGFGYAGRNLILTRSADAIIIICGRIGTLNEFTVAFEDKKPIGILEDSGGIADEIEDITRIAHKHQCRVLYQSNPKKLVAELIADLKEKYKEDKQKLNPAKTVENPE